MMELWIDTADLNYIKTISCHGLIKGITTNPTILSDATSTPMELLKQILRSFPDYHLAVQVTKKEPIAIIEQAKYIFDLKPENNH